MTNDETKIKVLDITIHSESQHTYTDDLMKVIVRCKKVNIRSAKGNTFEHLYEIDFFKEGNVFDFEDNDFGLELSGSSMKSLLTALLQEPSLRALIQDYLKDNP